ncbi:protein Fe65 homolog isoform X2 [Planococcus citri]|uniref:protein Fe65 homolog isoform X2 n=1 Tax=Planococcus citri TaxID=170843 RepID=UPI0031F7427F
MSNGDLVCAPLEHPVVRMRRYSLYPHLAHGMESCVPENEEDVCLTNGRLSFANPNYHLDPARLEEGLNSSSEEERRMYQEWFLRELEEACSLTNKSNSRKKPESRLSYASLDISDMGVDLNAGPVINVDVNTNSCNKFADIQKNRTILENVNLRYNNSNKKNINNRMGRRSLDLTNQTTTITNWTCNKPDLIENTESNANNEKENTYEKPTPPSTLPLNKQTVYNNTNSIPHITGQLNDDIYAVPVKTRNKSSPPQDEGTSSSSLESSTESSNNSPQENLPPGWERHEDNDGPYYWHIKSGIIQREPPTSAICGETNEQLKDIDAVLSSLQNLEVSAPQPVTRSRTMNEMSDIQEKRKKEELFLKRRSYPANFDSEYKEKGVRFAVRSLGWVEISEEDLTPERSSKAVNKCIVDLSLGINSIMDAVGRWGDGKDLFMDLDEGSLKLIDPENLTVLNTQPIHTIRVWGVGRDNGRDFAYVARDRTTRKHMCHVFRCDIPARTIANTLRDICKKIMIERSLQQNLTKTFDINGSCKQNSGAVRPTNLPTEYRRNHHRNNYTAISQSFPTPMEEPKKVLKALYLGSLQVNKASGMDVLNDAIDCLVNKKPQNEWEPVNVAVAPSTITISDLEDDKVIIECRVRYLSFLGIGKEVKHCAFIMHTAQDQFVAHVFHCEPSSGSLCKTIEAACKLRYQKCLDAHPAGLTKSQSTGNVTPNKSLGATLKSFVGSLTGRKPNTNS